MNNTNSNSKFTMTKSSKRFGIKAITLSLLVMLGVSVTGCFDNDSEPPIISYIALYNGSPDTDDGVDLYLDGNKVNSSAIDFGIYYRYSSITPGERAFSFTEFSKTPELAAITKTLEPNRTYSLFLAGELDDAEAILLTDSANNPATNKAYLRIINLSPDAGEVDLFTDDPVATNIEFKEATEFRNVDTGNVTIEILDSSTDAVLATISGTPLNAGFFYTVILRGYRSVTTGDTKLSAQLVQN